VGENINNGGVRGVKPGKATLESASAQRVGEKSEQAKTMACLAQRAGEKKKKWIMA